MTTTVENETTGQDDSAAGQIPGQRGEQMTEREAWIDGAADYVRTLCLPAERIPAGHPVRAWTEADRTRAEVGGQLLVKAAKAAAATVAESAAKRSDEISHAQAKSWFRDLGKVAKKPELGDPPDRWLAVAAMVRDALAWLPASFAEASRNTLADLGELAAVRAAAMEAAQDRALAEAIAAEVEARSALGAWETEQQRRQELKEWAAEAAAAEAKAQADKAAAKAREARQRLAAIPSPTDPTAVARHLQTEWKRDGVLILRRWQGTWMWWQGSFWETKDDDDVRAYFYNRLENAEYIFVDGRSGISEPRRWAPTTAKINNVADAFGALANLPGKVEAPGWADGRESGLIIPCRNGLLDMATRKLMPPSPLFFNTSAVPFDYNQRAPQPEQWIKFLGEVFPGDQAAVDALQERFGYILSGRRDMHKIFLLVGPRRSGKGTIAAILAALVGAAHVAGPTLGSMAGPFGIEGLIGKSLAIIPDARMPREPGDIVEKLLMISAGDWIDVARKHKVAWTGVLPTQIVIMSNELPTLPDAAEAIVGRLDPLHMTESFYGREDYGLLGKLMAELPSIFNWALVGLDRLTARGRLVEPESSTYARTLLGESSSPVGQFLFDRCVIDPGAVITKDAIWEAWQGWCQLAGRDHVGIRARFGRDLFAVAPKVRETRPTDPISQRQIPSYAGVRLKNLGE